MLALLVGQLAENFFSRLLGGLGVEFAEFFLILLLGLSLRGLDFLLLLFGNAKLFGQFISDQRPAGTVMRPRSSGVGSASGAVISITRAPALVA